MKKIILLLSTMALIAAVFAQQKTENVVIVTLDGLRWQEVFGGIDSALMNDRQFTRDSAALRAQFWDADVEGRRKKLFPFLWNEVAANGQLYGNRWLNNKVDVTNPYRFSYPGYNEIFTGYPDTAVNSNDKNGNPNVNVLEHLNKLPSYKNKVAAFATWDVFPYILNRQRSGLYVNAGFDSFAFNTPASEMLNKLQTLAPRPIGVRPDVITYLAAHAYLKKFGPRVLCIAFDETDDFAHNGQYDQYLLSAHAEDAMIADLWHTLQALPQYKNKTTLLITTDHGRGDSVKKEWRDHGEKIPEAAAIWIAAIGPDAAARGEVKTDGQLYQLQLAPTIAALLGVPFVPAHAGVQPIQPLFKKP